MKPLILIVDDTPRNLQLLGGILSEEGYEISFAQSGASALSILQNISPDLVLLDVMMPEMDGYELCERILQEERNRSIPILFLSAKIESEDVLRGFEAGGVDYISKPFQAKELLARIHTHVELKRSKDDLRKFHDRISEELAIARSIQESLIKIENNKDAKCKIYNYYKPADEIGGDFIFTHWSEFNHRLDLFFGDVSGHGIGSAMVGAMSVLAFQNSVQNYESPADSLYAINDSLLPLIQDFNISCVYFSLFPEEKKIFYSYGGHPSIYLIKGKELIELEGVGSLLLIPQMKHFENFEVSLNDVEGILMFSDGMYEFYDQTKRLVDLDSFLNLIRNSLPVLNSESFLDTIAEKTLQLSNHKIQDDMSMLYLEIQ
ncbi:MAG: response regulator [Leptospiraceae bacterium]|nr:response regulator [Leptospiraceae bacterium]